MLISDEIAKIIESMLDNSNGKIEIKRNDLAGKIGCVPSQINYVITSRFTPQKGYIIESRRGGGGYIRIVRKHMDKNTYLMHLFHSLGNKTDDELSKTIIKDMFDKKIITSREADIIFGMIKRINDDEVKADALRAAILSIMD